MSAAMQRPAWQTEELQEEWVDLEPEDDDTVQSYGAQSVSLTAPLASMIQTNSSLGRVGTPPNAGEADGQVGTFLVREDAPYASMPYLPKTPGRNKKNAIKDFFTPLPLERMFDPPTPPISAGDDASPPSPSPPRSAILRVAEVEQEEEQGQDEILETDMPYIKSFNGRKHNIACQFTFSVPKDIARLPSGDFPQAQSTPPLSPNNNGLVAPPTDSRLRLFHFQYDTYTREHLSALVDSIAVATPSGTGSGATPPSYQHNLSRLSEGSGSDVSHLRSAKRVKLSPASDFSGQSVLVGAPIGRPKLKGADYVGESRLFMEKIKQARDYSTFSTVAGSNTSPSLESKTDVDAPSLQDENPLKDSTSARRPFLVVPARPKTQESGLKSSTSKSPLSQPSSPHSSFNYRQSAATLMEQIKSDMKGHKRILSGDTDISSGTAEDRTEVNRSMASGGSYRVRLNLPEKENRGPNSPLRAHRRAPSSKIVASRSKSTSNKPARQTDDGISEGLSRISLEDRHMNPIKQVDVDRPPAQTAQYLAPPTHLTASVRPNGNEDLNRFVSSSTASGTTLTAGSAPSFVKHPGPAHLRTIAPGDLPPMPERLGDMLFDKVMMKWVKSTARATQNPEQTVMSLSEMSDDPFGDIDSLEESRPREARLNRTRTPDLEGGEDEEDARGAVAEIIAIGERPEAADAEEVELTSFSTDASMHVVDIMTAVDTSGYNDDDETTDSDEDILDTTVTAPVVIVDDESGDEDVSPTRHDYGNPGVSAAAPFAHPPHEPINTPNRKLRSTSITPVLRSVLKSGSATPCSTFRGRGRYQTPHPTGRHRRSVSFSDGKLDGPIQGLDDSTASDPTSSRSRAAPNATMPSVRSKRIADMMDALANSDWSDDGSPSKSSSSASGRPESLYPLAARPPVTALPGTDSKREGSRRGLPGRQFTRHSPRRVVSDKANATFLTECSFAVAHDRLVEVITDVQPFEPFWDGLSTIDLSSKRLESVARLKEFLPHLDTLNLNSNLLAWLSGVPGTVRTLSVAHNSLSSLTSYSHLLNIESLDISNNDVDSLRQLECLRHLRELKADGNKITSVDGLQRMDGLVKLSLQGNAIRSLDLSQYRWTRLEMLNVSHNRLDSVKGLASLQSLIAVNFDNNSLRKLDFGNGMARLRILRVSSNKLPELVVAALPNLRTLYADNNSLNAVTKVDRLTKLENLSLRNQSGRTLNLLTRDVRDVKRLYLSGNPLKSPLLHEPCYNLVYLELAACRLATLSPVAAADGGSSRTAVTLPEGRLSALAPNLRVLNLNYNFLKDDDMKQLEGLGRLQKLTLIGSRVRSTKPLIRLVQGLKDAELLDFRMNPCTLGWYLPLLVKELPGTAAASTAEPTGLATAAISAGGGSGGGASRTGKNNNHSSSGSSNINSNKASSASLAKKVGSSTAAAQQDWQELDAKFRRDLPDDAYVGRLAYRGLIMRACPRIRLLDGVAISEKEKAKAEELLEGILGMKGERTAAEGGSKAAG